MIYVVGFLLLSLLSLAVVVANAALLAPFFSVVARVWLTAFGAWLFGRIAFELFCWFGQFWARGASGRGALGGDA